jgi:hypothetical protein
MRGESASTVRAEIHIAKELSFFLHRRKTAWSPTKIFDMVKLTVRFHKVLASYAYERLAKKRLNEERDCQR